MSSWIGVCVRARGRAAGFYVLILYEFHGKKKQTNLTLARSNCTQILRDREFQSRGDRRQQTESGHRARGGLHSELQARKPDHVRLGDPRQTAGGGRLHSRQRAERIIHQSVSGLVANNTTRRRGTLLRCLHGISRIRTETRCYRE